MAAMISAVPMIGKTLYLPVFWMMRPTTMVPAIIPSINGSISRPDLVGLTPFTICRYSGIIIIPPNMPIPMSTDIRLIELNTGLRNSRIGIRASSPMARSTKTQTTRPATPTA